MTGLGLLALAAPLVIGLWLAWVWDDKRAAGRWAPMLGLALVVGVALIAGRRYRRRVVRSLRDGARTIDFGFVEPPNSPLVSTGPGSLVTPGDIGREGARYVGSRTLPDDVQDVTGQAAIAEPIRVFVGLDAADSIAERVQIALDELRRCDAFSRSVLVIQAPAGTGFANSTPVDVLELLARGDCASVAVGYGLLPSFLSLNRVDIARQTQAALMEGVARECARAGMAPRIVLYGESLGAKVQQEALRNGFDDMDQWGIARALWVGTPGGREHDEAHDKFRKSSVTVDRPEQVPSSGRSDIRVWFLEHDADPVVRFRARLAYRRPAWLPTEGDRGRGVPVNMRWLPAITWAQVLVDTAYATDITPGDFRSCGHDYRADLGVVTAAAFGLVDGDRQVAGAASPERSSQGTLSRWEDNLEGKLRALELRRADRIDRDA